MMAGERHARGFTLLELMTVLCVLGLVAAIVAPPVSGMLRSSRLAGATNTLVADVRQTRALANAQRTTFSITVTDSAHYVITNASTGDVVQQRQMPTGVTLAATDTTNFYAWGLTDAVTLTLVAGSDYRILSVAANGSVTRD